MSVLEKYWGEVEYYLGDAVAITWDECHKIYVLLDEEQVELMVSYGYEPIIRASGVKQGVLLNTIKDWYANSCGLRFITAVRSVGENENPNEGFTDLIPQGADEEEEDY